MSFDHLFEAYPNQATAEAIVAHLLDLASPLPGDATESARVMREQDLRVYRWHVEHLVFMALLGRGQRMRTERVPLTPECRAMLRRAAHHLGPWRYVPFRGWVKA